ncbi:PIR protein [Plasmodium sp. gorilla clade G1]|nr:PIR protein [Plasmodium sp. gorilla clade G1]
MKLHYPKILLFSIPLNILITSSSNAHNKNKIYIKSHTPTTTSRVLSECDLYVSSYDNDPDMKSVRENFDRQTSQRFEEYNERMNRKRQKYKEQCDKDIQQIIVKDKMQKSLAEKVEKGCLMCACGLGGGVAPVWGLVSGLWYATLSQYVSAKALEAGIKKGLEVGLYKVKEIVTQLLRVETSNVPTIEKLLEMTSGTFTNEVSLLGIFKSLDRAMFGKFNSGTYTDFAFKVQSIANSPYSFISFTEKSSEVEIAFNNAKTGVLTETGNATSSLSSAIMASFIAIVVIVLVMLIIYLILRYRRKKKMYKKQQYTKLLKE